MQRRFDTIGHWVFCATVLMVLTTQRTTYASPAGDQCIAPIRGVWVANVGSDVLSSAANTREFVDLCSQCGVNTLFVVVWNRGATVYPSEVMQQAFGIRCDPRYQGRDALRDIVHAAHAKDIRVFAWFEFGFSSSYRQADGGHILRTKPHWAARNLQGEIVSKNNFQWMNAFHPEVQDFMLDLMREVVEQYDVDGVQGDDRLPAMPSTAGYDDWTVNLYRAQHNGRLPPENPSDADWISWRANLLNQFAERMYRELNAIDPRIIISAAPSIYPWSKQEYLQEWPVWLANGWIDFVCPQIYRHDIESYSRELARIGNEQVSEQKLARVFPGVLIKTADGYSADASFVTQMLAENRRQGFAGEVFFYDAGVVQHATAIRKFYESEAATE